MILCWFTQAEDLAVLIRKKKMDLKLKNMTMHLFVLNMFLYNEFPKFWRKRLLTAPPALSALENQQKKSQAVMEEATY